MPIELPICRGEYWWSQSQPISATLIAALHLPHRCSMVVTFGQGSNRMQSITLSLAQSATGMGHLTLSDIQHQGCAEEPAVTRDLFYLLMNTTVAILQHHCQRQVSLGGQVPCALLSGLQRTAIAWEHWGFQLLASTGPGYRRVLARVRTLKIASPPSHTGYFPVRLTQAEQQWTAA